MLLCLLAALSVPTLAQSEEDGYTVFIQSSPPYAGSVVPGLGAHKIQIGQTVKLSAQPKQGYRFLYWLGDVSSTSDADTTIHVDSPKLVIANFVREKFEENPAGSGIVGGQFSPGGGGSSNPIQSPGSVNPASGDFGGVDFRLPVPPDGDDDIPVPDDDDDIPVPGGNETPEPSTLLLMGLSSIALLQRRKKRK